MLRCMCFNVSLCSISTYHIVIFVYEYCMKHAFDVVIGIFFSEYDVYIQLFFSYFFNVAILQFFYILDILFRCCSGASNPSDVQALAMPHLQRY
jgi:hypothetical protein